LSQKHGQLKQIADAQHVAALFSFKHAATRDLRLVVANHELSVAVVLSASASTQTVLGGISKRVSSAPVAERDDDE